MLLYNTLTRSKDEFIVRDNTVRMYACGPTVYNFFHIGNARVFVVFDMLRRYLEYKGYNVKFVQNFTDVDDKLIRKAAEEGITVKEVADKYINEYFIDAKGLGVLPASVHPRATENIDEIINTITALIERGHAYVSGNDVYFDSTSFNEYGKLSHMPIDDLEAGARIDVTEIKRNPMDFALWKGKKEGEIFWDSPWGEGRPGWHIECSAMVHRYLGEDIDIHCGGQDLIFPHHENEIAQSECATGECFARFWLHNGYINVDNKKMSKSLNNFFLVRDAAKEHGYQAIRYFLLASHYRSPINYTSEILEQAKSAVERLQNCQHNIEFRIEKASKREMNDSEKASISTINDKKSAFIAAMDDDFNTADAIGCLFEITKEINLMMKNEDCSYDYIDSSSKVFMELVELLGFSASKDESVDESAIEAMIAERTEAKKNKDYKKADEIREKLKEMGIIIQDTSQGVKWKKA